MFNFINDWWTGSNFTGPARNAPNNGKNIKELFEHRPAQVIIVTNDQVVNIRNNLRKTIVNDKQEFIGTPIMVELNSVFQQGNSSYFEKCNKYGEMIDIDELMNRTLEQRIEARDKIVEKLKEKREGFKSSFDVNSLENIKKRNKNRQIIKEFVNV